ncbi:MAG: hypothetical protein ACR2JU_12310 [Nocardioidaceae bacterium]
MSDASELERERPWLPLLSAVPVLLVLPVAAVAGSVALWMGVAVFLAAGLAYREPDSGRGAFALGLAAAVWVFAGPEALSAWSLVVALLLLTSHAALALRATAAPATDFGGEVLRRWGLRSTAVAAVTAVGYVVAAAVGSLPRSSTGAAVAVGLVLLAGLVVLLRHETVKASDSA